MVSGPVDCILIVVVATRTESSSIKVKEAFRATKVSVIVHSVFKKLFGLSTVYMIVNVQYHKLFNI